MSSLPKERWSFSTKSLNHYRSNYDILLVNYIFSRTNNDGVQSKRNSATATAMQQRGRLGGSSPEATRPEDDPTTGPTRVHRCTPESAGDATVHPKCRIYVGHILSVVCRHPVRASGPPGGGSTESAGACEG